MPDQEPLGREYLLHEEIGRGAVAVVRRATSRRGGPPLAAKLLRPELAGDRRVRELFLREEAALRDLSHPAIVRLRDLIVEGGTLALVMDLIGGPDLRRYLEFRGGRLAQDETGSIVGQIAAALAAAHAQGVEHLDLKPENILVVNGPSGPEVRITDFGVAVLLHDADQRAAGGTPGYSAPEIFTGAPPTAAADVWSLGVLLVELFTGSVAGDPAALPAALAPVARDCLAEDPRRRPPARQVATYLRNLTPPAPSGFPAAPAGFPAAPEGFPAAPAGFAAAPASPPSFAGDNLTQWADRQHGRDLNETRLRPGITPAPPPPPETTNRAATRWRRGPLITLGVAALIVVTLTGVNVAASAGERRQQAIQQVSVAPQVTVTTTAPPASLPPTTGLAVPPPTTSPAAERLRVTLAGQVDNGAGTLAISIRDGKAIAYVCDGKRVESWLRGTARAGVLALKGKDGSRITGTFDDRGAEGDITVEGDTNAFQLAKVRKPSGLYRTAARVRGAEVVGSWIVLDDGRQVGVLSADGVPAPAPRLDLDRRTTTVDGTTVRAKTVDVDSGAGF